MKRLKVDFTMKQKTVLPMAQLLLLCILCIPSAAQTICDGKVVIGMKTTASFTQLGLYDLPTKVDTGAYTSSMHCSDITIDTLSNRVTCQPYKSKNRISFPLSRIDRVKSSNGIMEMRPFVILKIAIENRTYETEFSLNDRSNLKYPVLLGRRLLRGNFIVDVAK